MQNFIQVQMVSVMKAMNLSERGNRLIIKARRVGTSLWLFLSGLLMSGCAALPEKNIYTSIDIHAPKELVWSILKDNAAYPEWNPYHVVVGGNLVEGDKLTVSIQKPNGKSVELEPHVIRLSPQRELTWGGGVHGIFYGEHVFLLDSLAENRTRLIHKEKFAGLAVPFAALDAIEEGYTLMNLALKQRAEAMYSGQ